MKPTGTFSGRQGVALRHQQSGLSWWGAGWGHWGGIPKAAPSPARHWLATGGHSFSQGRMQFWPRGAGWGHRGDIPRVGCPLPPLPGRGGCSPSHSRPSPWLRDAGWGHGGGIPRTGSPVPHRPAVGYAAIPRPELTAPVKVHATSPAHLAVQVVLASRPQAANLGAMWERGDQHTAAGAGIAGAQTTQVPSESKPSPGCDCTCWDGWRQEPAALLLAASLFPQAWEWCWLESPWEPYCPSSAPALDPACCHRGAAAHCRKPAPSHGLGQEEP